MILRLSTVIIALALLSCTSTPTDSSERPTSGIAALKKDARLGEEVGRICFAGQIDGFRTFSKDMVIVESGLRKEFIVETVGGCQNLRQAQAIGLPSGLSCLSDMDKILVYDSAFGTQTTPFSTERCSIRSIHRWNEKADPVELDGIRPEDIEPIMEPLK